MDSWTPKLVAEFVATFSLVFIGAGSIVANHFTGGGVGLLGIALAHGLVLAIFVTATMNISGGHVNPAVTLGAMATGYIDRLQGVAYIVAQLLGGTVAAYLLTLLFPAGSVSATSAGATLVASGVSVTQAVALETVLSFFLVYTVFATGIDNDSPQVGGFAIGLVLTFDILAGGALTGASMNPARSFGPALVSSAWASHWVYWVGPAAGGLIAALLYHFTFLRDRQ